MNSQQQQQNNKQELEQHNDSESAKSPDLFQDNNTIKKKKALSKALKQETILSNISYTGINKEDFQNKNFVFDVYVSLTKNLNPFLIDRKLWKE